MSLLSSLFPCFRDDPAPPVTRRPSVSAANPWTIGPIINGVNYSAGMPQQPTPVGSWFAFTFPTAKPGVHAMTRATTAADARSLVGMTFDIDAQADIRFHEVDHTGLPEPGPGNARLFLQRRGDDWGGAQTGKSSYRFYSAPVALEGGTAGFQVPLTPDQWTNVDGINDPAGFASVLADLETVGLGFGGMFAMHGVYATGPAIFTLREFVLA